MRRPPLNDTKTRDIGPYRLAHRIAVGGMAEVYRALWPQSAGGDRAVVIKRLLPGLLKDPEQRSMFDHEAELGRRIDHPNVVGVLDHRDDEGVPYLVLEYVFGVDLWRLARFLRQRGLTLRTPLALWIGSELLAGLSAVHAVRDDQGVLLHVCHRDISPSNVFLSVHGDVKLGDLGIARAALREAQRRPGQGFRAKGKLGYLPPEQVAGLPLDQRGDVFAAAVVIAELLMGQPLFAGATEIAVLLAIRDGDVGTFRGFAPRLPPGLGDALLRALDRHPEQRTESAARLREELLAFVTEPIQPLRAELGGLVVAAMDEAGEVADRTSLAQTIEHDPRHLDSATPPPLLKGKRAVYWIERGSTKFGPYTLSDLVRAIAVEEARATDRVRVEDGSSHPIASVPQLARHLPPSTRTPDVRRRTEMVETSELFDLGQRSPLGLLIDLYLLREEGLLLCERGEIRKEVYLERGVANFVTSNQPGELLGESLVRRGLIDRAELEMALSVMPRFEGHLGETLVALELVDPVILIRQISRQVQDKLLELFLWTDGHAALYRGVQRPEGAFPLSIDAWDLFETGAARRLAAGFDTALLQSPPDGQLETTRLEIEHLTLSHRLAELWSNVHAAPRTLVDIERMGSTPPAARAAVLVLMELGALRWRSSEG